MDFQSPGTLSLAVPIWLRAGSHEHTFGLLCHWCKSLLEWLAPRHAGSMQQSSLLLASHLSLFCISISSSDIICPVHLPGKQLIDVNSYCMLNWAFAPFLALKNRLANALFCLQVVEKCKVT